jgi:tetratricopeptide (TPR) repeat protein
MARFDKLELNSQKNQEEAKADLNLTPQTRDEAQWMTEADRERRLGHHETSLKYYSRALELDRTIVSAWVGQVQMLVQLDENREAELWARKAIEIFPGNAELFAGRAQALCRMGDLKQAQELSDGALQREGASAYRWMVRGEIMLCRKQKAESHCFEKAMQTDADWLNGVEIALLCRYHGAPAQGLRYLRGVLEKESDQPYPWYVAGLCQADLDMVGAATHSFQRCVDVAPGHVDAMQQIAALSQRSFSPGRWLRGLWRRS